MSKQSIEERNERMERMHSQGCALQAIGDQYGVTRERVRQILAKRGVTASDGGISVRSALKAKQLQAKREAASLRKYGLPHDLMCELREQGLTNAFTRQRLNAEQRAIAWHLTFAQWFSIWQASGKLHLRGRGKGKYVMSRILDDGPYALGNVHIQLSTENSREAVSKWRGQVKENRGVYCLYPGRKLAWLSKVADVSLGYFETEAEAVAAREKYFTKNPGARRQGRGYAFTGTKESPRYQVMVNKTYVGTYKTTEEALAARDRFIESREHTHA